MQCKHKMTIIVPDMEEVPAASVRSPRLAYPQQADAFHKEVGTEYEREGDMAHTIVLAHEDATFTQDVQSALEATGYLVDIVATGQAALDRCKATVPDMLIIGAVADEAMSILQELRNSPDTEDIKVMWIMPAHSDEEIMRAWHADADCVVNPPISAEEIACLSRLLFEGPPDSMPAS